MIQRRLITIEGMVQGVGFRPFAYRLAAAHDLHGLVQNNSAGVLVDVEGEQAALDSFVAGLVTGRPSSAIIETVHAAAAVPGRYGKLDIAPSTDGPRRSVLVPPDLATCDACIAELFDPADRRYRYPFLTCTDCGPRFTVVETVPYDRSRTTMATFAMCDECRQEYESPVDRRFHAQSIACSVCGPTLRLETFGSATGAVPGEAALTGAAESLGRGEIVALKGLGGFHLACDATEDAAVRRLRARKQREAKPFAIMVRTLDDAHDLCEVSDLEAALLAAPERPILLLAKRPAIPVAASVAPDTRYLGVMLPYTPVHHLLLEQVRRPLVMTSGNRSDEPIAYQDDDARVRLGAIADAMLHHDRPISTRCDDSVVTVVRDGPAFVRRARGWAPRPIRMLAPFSAPVLALGGQLKSTICLGIGSRAFLSHHLGDLDSPEAVRALEESVAHYAGLFDVRPELVAHDLHPDYRSTRLAEEMPDVELVGVQHHHAHVAACMVEHGVTEPVLGVAFDGAGLGLDGAIWGGEFLLVDSSGFRRVAHLGYVPLPGGDAAARAPWRMAVAHLWAAFGDAADPSALRCMAEFDRPELPFLEQMLRRRLNCPLTSSMGRLFDAAAALLGLRSEARFEGQAAMDLEMAADPAVDRSYPVEVSTSGETWIIEPAPVIRGVVEDVRAGRPAAEIAGAFHRAVCDMILEVAARTFRQTGVRRVALTGGVFQNRLLTEQTAAALSARGFEVLLHRQTPCNDGSLSLGQAAIAGGILRRVSACV